MDAAAQPADPLESLAEEVGLLILSFLPYKCLLSARLVCKHWNGLVDDDVGIWVRVYINKYVPRNA
jgi:hypothetical protein